MAERCVSARRPVNAYRFSGGFFVSFKAVLFDLDGTLLDTLDDLADSANSAFRQLGCPEHSVEAFKYFIGDGVESLVRRGLPPDRCDAATVAQCSTLMRKQYSERWACKTRPYEGGRRVARRFDRSRHPDGRAIEQAGRVHQAMCFAVAATVAIRGRRRRKSCVGQEAGPGGRARHRSPDAFRPRRDPLPGRHRHRHADGRCRRHVSRRRLVGGSARPTNC